MRSATRQLSSIARIYKNAAGDTLAFDHISININKEQSNRATFDRWVDTVDTKRTLVHLSSGGDRVVALVQSIGDYTEIDEDAGNFFVVRYIPDDAVNENTVEISLEPYVAKIGDIL